MTSLILQKAAAKAQEHDVTAPGLPSKLLDSRHPQEFTNKASLGRAGPSLRQAGSRVGARRRRGHRPGLGKCSWAPCCPYGPAGDGQGPTEAMTGWEPTGGSCEEARSLGTKGSFFKDCHRSVPVREGRENTTFF